MFQHRQATNKCRFFIGSFGCGGIITSPRDHCATHDKEKNQKKTIQNKLLSTIRSLLLVGLVCTWHHTHACGAMPRPSVSTHSCLRRSSKIINQEMGLWRSIILVGCGQFWAEYWQSLNWYRLIFGACFLPLHANRDSFVCRAFGCLVFLRRLWRPLYQGLKRKTDLAILML